MVSKGPAIGLHVKCSPEPVCIAGYEASWSSCLLEDTTGQVAGESHIRPEKKRWYGLSVLLLEVPCHAMYPKSYQARFAECHGRGW